VLNVLLSFMSFSLHNSRFGLYVDFTNPIQGQIQDLKFEEEHLQNYFWGISCEKSRFYVKKSYFFQF
jgi:hypothetical protein